MVSTLAVFCNSSKMLLATSRIFRSRTISARYSFARSNGTSRGGMISSHFRIAELVAHLDHRRDFVFLEPQRGVLDLPGIWRRIGWMSPLAAPA